MMKLEFYVSVEMTPARDHINHEDMLGRRQLVGKFARAFLGGGLEPQVGTRLYRGTLNKLNV